jgi:hypothetical protein
MDANKISWEEGKRLQARYRKNREGIRLDPQMASICLICGSIHVYPVAGGAAGLLECRNCGFAFLRYPCSACGNTVDERDPANPGCDECEARVCSCGSCSCPDSLPQRSVQP